MFITFEGIDGSGKTTQSKLIANYFRQILGEHHVVLTREPGGTLFAEEIRKILLKNNIAPLSELLLLLSLRYEHMNKIILPSLEKGKIVICDRFIDSTIAYQGYALGLDLDLIRYLHQLVKIQYPDMTFVLDIEIAMGLKRTKIKTKYEKMNRSLYEKVRMGFQKIAIKEPKRCILISHIEDKCQNQVYREIVSYLQHSSLRRIYSITK
ncbi:dTMP kinase [Wolbachia endosymbiont of Howardula sp.]|uniref:dTMP kinase n=1 Tax=Wolbachia endosymbiont of Howardula sp. TaxID=2916816 RepID=UPI00217E15DA|nr:dTMP kinase [Wolbachia endosymbiont of Howardula sp.]UWI83266.1 dTMP kinase [Wolbachia endosymbiont of Howardula sp.]